MRAGPVVKEGEDILLRLRKNVDYYRSMEAPGPAKDDEDAADEIERLRALVKHIRVVKL